MPNDRIIIPLLNETVKLFEAPTFYFDTDTFIEVIYIEDFGAFFSDIDSQHRDGINKNTKCIYIENPEFDNFNEFVKNLAVKLKYSLNRFSIEHPPILPYAYLLNKGDHKQSSSILEIADIEAVANIHKLRTQPFRVDVEREKLSDFFKVVDVACKNKPNALFTIDRFNSCLTRAADLDQIVDACISLESLISGTSELVYRFSLYHSLIAESDIDERLKVFEYFKNLYSARSTIVHGDLNDKALRKVRDNWAIIKGLAIKSINYYLTFLYKYPESKWDDHLQNLALGVDKRLF